jgi:hypothetical protein
MTKGIKISCKHKRELYKSMKNSNCEKIKMYYKNYCKILSRVITAAKKMNHDNNIKKSHNKMKTMWKIINFETGRKLNSSGSKTLFEVQKGQNAAEHLNDYFTSIAENMANKLITNYPNSTNTDFRPSMELSTLTNYPSLLMKPSTTNEIESIIKSLKSKVSHGYDQISTKILKTCAPFISSPLNHICNLLIATGKFPDRLKYSEVIPLYKKGDKNQPSNYRPISLLTAFSKVIEKIMFYRLMNHLNKHNILSTNQFGFQKNVSVDDAIYRLLDEVLTALNKHSKIIGIFCDINKAFD